VHDARMDDIFLCPDCLTEHREPLEARLGHRVRCSSCAMAVEIEVAYEELPTLELEIHIAA
jgi:hydrogenase maturation factor HypF (carbamoyltransferase family)